MSRIRPFIRVQRLKDVLLVIALVALVVQVFAISGASQAVAQGRGFVQDVFITNTGSNPVPVEMTSAATVTLDQREAYQRNLANSSTLNEGRFVDLFFDVPDGTRLVIESASVRVQVPAGQAGEHLTARLSANVQSADSAVNVGIQHLVLESQGTFDDLAMFTANHSMLLWADAGENSVNVRVERASGDGPLIVEASIVGYLEDV